LKTEKRLEIPLVCRSKLPTVFPAANKETAAASRGGKV